VKRVAAGFQGCLAAIVVCAAIGQANRQYTSALAAVANATGEREGRR